MGSKIYIETDFFTAISEVNEGRMIVSHSHKKYIKKDGLIKYSDPMLDTQQVSFSEQDVHHPWLVEYYINMSLDDIKRLL